MLQNNKVSSVNGEWIMADMKDAQAAFLEAVDGLKEYAEVNGQTVSREDVLNYFKGIELDERSLSMVYGYLMANGVQIKDAAEGENSFLQMMEQAEAKAVLAAENGVQEQEEQTAAVQIAGRLDYEADEKYLALYLSDLRSMEALSDTSRAFLLMNILEDNDSESLKLFSESFLEKIVDWVEPYRRKGVLASDLVQEANLAMMAYVSQKRWMNNVGWKERIREGSTGDLLDVLKEIEQEVRSEVAESLQRLMDEQQKENQVAERVLGRVNLVNDWAVRLKTELGRKPTTEEVAEKMGISTENVREAIQLSAEAIGNINYKEK